jgi:hypothetical protein
MTKRIMALTALMAILVLGVAQAFLSVAPASNEELCSTSYTFKYNASTGGAYNVSIYRSTLPNGSLPWVKIYTESNTSAAQVAYAVTISGITWTAGHQYRINFTASLVNGSLESDASIVNVSIDQTGPALSFTGTTTKNRDSVMSDDFYIGVTSNETLSGAPTINFNGKLITLKGSGLSWYYDFADAELADNTYNYIVTADDDTACTNTGTASREVNIYSKASVGVKQEIQEQQQTQQGMDKAVLIAIAAVAVYVVFLRKGKGRKK